MAPLETRLFINNEFVDAKSSDRITVVNPRNGQSVTEDVHVAGPEDVDRAVAAASQAFTSESWAGIKSSERCKLLSRLADLIEENGASLAHLESIAMGNAVPMVQAMDVSHAAEVFRYYAGWVGKMAGESFPAEDGYMRIVKHEPLGVCASVCAWNASLMFFAWKAAPALAMGNTLIIKSSETSPLSYLELGQLVVQAGFPPGVVQFLSGAGQTGNLLALHKDIRKISFTGSTGVGRKIVEAAAKSNLKRVTLELGGKSPAIVFSDADLDQAIHWCSAPGLINGGQICASTSRLYLHKDIADQFLSKLKVIYTQAGEALGTEASPPNLSPAATSAQFKRVLQYIESGKKEAKLFVGGASKDQKGYWIKPTIFLEPENDAAVYKEEIFGPVLVVKVFDNEEQAVGWANDSEYGLAAAVFTQDITRAMRVANLIHSGSVSINSGPMPSVATPFGGVKQSGWGRELGKNALEEYSETKSISIWVGGSTPKA